MANSSEWFFAALHNELQAFTGRVNNPDPIDLCALCGEYLGNKAFTHFRQVHKVEHMFLDVRGEPGVQYQCMCGAPFGIYRHWREHIREHGVNCYHVYLLTGGYTATGGRTE
jgi:hypothetical protein